jgi:TonB-linked SusC/RagA family outer membrane protein
MNFTIHRHAKVYFVMRLTAFLLTAFCLQVSAGAFSQQVSISVKNAPVERVLQQIKQQSGYAFFYDAEHLRKAKRVTMDLKKASIEEALEQCFSGQPFTYEIIEKTIVIKQRIEPPPTAAAPLVFKVSGKVTNEAGEPIPGVNVKVKGANIITATNERGEYTINAPDATAVLVFSFIGYNTREMEVKGEHTINIQLTAESQSLNAIVVVGFGTQKKVNLTGAVSQVEGKTLQNRPVANIGQALQGTVPNLNLTTTGDPGGPGTNASFNIRGTARIGPVDANASPLFVVDGMPVNNINDINPNDVENMSVLKDAAASAIYGARAPYGVILVTTKKGRKGEKTAVSYNTMFGQSSYTRLPKMANSLVFAQAYNVAALNSGQGVVFSEEQLEKIRQNIARPGSNPVATPDPSIPNRYTYASPLNTDNVDWFKAYFKPWSFNQKHDLSLSGGSQNTTYYMGLGYYDQGGQLRYGDEKFRRYNVTGNLHMEPTKWLRVDMRTRYSKRDLNIPYEYPLLNGNWIHLVTTRQPNWALRNPDGHFSAASGLEGLSNGGRHRNAEDNLTLTGSVELEPIKNWKVNVDYSYNSQVFRDQWHSAYYYSWGPDGSKYNVGPSQNSTGGTMISNGYQTANFYSSYEKSLGRHNVKLLVGQQLEVFNNYELSGERADLITDNIPSISTATGTQNTSDAILHWATTGTFARINYNYDEKFLLELNGRYDGTSRFPEGHRFGFFPSVSAGYNLAREAYWEPLKDDINEFKIRASYGSLGNQNINDPYLFLPTIALKNNLGYILDNRMASYLNAPILNSIDLTWETSRTFDVGLDAAFLNNRLTLSYDWYVRSTVNLLGPASVLPATLGAAVPFQNNADLETKGFELSLSWNDKVGKEFSYYATLVLSDYKSTVKRFYNPTNLLSDEFPGKTVGDIWGLETRGLIQSQKDIETMPDQSFFFGSWTEGDVMYADLNGDGKIDIGKNTLSDHGDLKVIGNSTPRYAYGVRLGFDWKGIDFSMFWQGIAKRDIWLGGTNDEFTSGSENGNSGNIFWGFVPNYGNNVYKTTLDFWTPDNRDAYWPKPYLSSEVAKNHKIQSRYLQNAAYLRLKNIQIGYDLSRLLKGSGISRLRIFASAENLLTITSLNKNYDPEVLGGAWGTGKIYPLLKTISVGANLNF